MLAPEKAAHELTKLKMVGDQVDDYISRFHYLAEHVEYNLNNKAVLDLFRKGLPWSLRHACLNFNQPTTWETWTTSAKSRQCILTILEEDKPEVPVKRTTTDRPMKNSVYPRPYPELPMAKIAKAVVKQTKRSLAWLE